MKNLNYIFLLLIAVSCRAQELKFGKPKTIANDKFLLQKISENKGKIKFSIEKNGVEVLSDSVYNYPTIKFELFYFDDDKNLDFRIRYDSSFIESDIRKVYLSNHKTGKLVTIDDYFFDAVHLQGNYFYRYNESRIINTMGIIFKDDESCVNLNWLCHLYKIEGTNFHPIGEMSARGCEERNIINLKKIKVQKVFGDYEKYEFFEEIEYSKKITNKKTRLNFIKKYWIKNIDEFK